MDEIDALNKELTEALTDGRQTITVDRNMAIKILIDLEVLRAIRKEVSLLDRRDELEQKG